MVSPNPIGSRLPAPPLAAAPGPSARQLLKLNNFALMGPSGRCPDRPRTGAWARLPRSDDHCAQRGLKHLGQAGLGREQCGARPRPGVFAGAAGDRGPPGAIPGLRGFARRPPALHQHFAAGILEHPCACHTAALVSLRRPAPAQISRLRGGAPGPLQVRSRCQNDGSGKSHQNASGKHCFKFITPHPARFRAVQPSGGPASRVEWIRAGKRSADTRRLTRVRWLGLGAAADHLAGAKPSVNSMRTPQGSVRNAVFRCRALALCATGPPNSTP
jgi:hypothetical protein